MTNSIMLALVALGVAGFFLIPAYALDQGVYLVESDEIFFIVSIPSNSTTSSIISEGGIIVNGTWNYFDGENLTLSNIDGDKGRFFGETDTGNKLYITYDTIGDSVQIDSKVWHDGTKTITHQKAETVKILGESN